MPNDGIELPGSKTCVGCGGLTFRNRTDDLCPRCAYQAEHLIEQIELECLDRDLTLITRFEAYCQQRDARRERAAAGHPRDVFDAGTPLFEPTRLRERPFGTSSHWSERRSA